MDMTMSLYRCIDLIDYQLENLSSGKLTLMELLSNLVYAHQAATLSDCSPTCTPSTNFTLLTTNVNRLNPLILIHRF